MDARVAADRYRFSGYQLPTIRLDDGFDYVVSLDHPAYTHGEPLWWHEKAVSQGTNIGHNIDRTGYPTPGDDVPIL